MHSIKSPSHLGDFSNCKHRAWISVLFIFLVGLVFQGCVIQDHRRGHSRHTGSVTTPAPIVFTFTNHHRRTAQNFYHRHPRHHGKKHAWKKTWRHKRKSHLHTRIQMQTLPFDLRRQLPPAPRGTQYIYVDDQLLLVNVKTRLILDFINIKVPVNQNTYNRKPVSRAVDRMPSYQEQHPSQTHQPPTHARAHEVAQGKPYMKDDHPSSHAQNNQGQDHRMNKGKPDIGEDHPSQHAKNDRGHGQQDKGKPLWGDKSSSDHPKMYKGNQGGGPDKEKGRPSSMGQGNQDHKKDEPQKDQGRPSKGKGKPAMDSPIVDDTGSHQMDARGKPGKGKPEGKGKQKDTFADSSQQENSSAPSSSHTESKGKRPKQDRNSARGLSGQQDREQVQPNPAPEENIQVAKVEQGRGKGNSKGPGKPNKMKRGKREQETDMIAPATQQEAAPSTAPPQPTTTASIAPSTFDSNQRSIIQSYYQNVGSKKSGKGKKPRRSKRNKTASVSKNDILTQSTEPLPRKLESLLPLTSPNTRRTVYNQQVLLVENGTNRVLDVINVNN
jgi:Ni/Co efflux regulator RcnB